MNYCVAMRTNNQQLSATIWFILTNGKQKESGHKETGCYYSFTQAQKQVKPGHGVRIQHGRYLCGVVMVEVIEKMEPS